jgi:hypothetical protein
MIKSHAQQKRLEAQQKLLAKLPDLKNHDLRHISDLSFFLSVNSEGQMKSLAFPKI